MKRIFNFNIITPIIISGFNRNEAELRPQSIKGMLRWWFRFYKSSFLNVDELRKFENEVFGSTEGSTLFYMRLLKEPKNKGDAYLCMNDKRRQGQKGAQKDYYRIRRNSYLASQPFQIGFRFFPHFEYENEVETALMLLSLLGGIGARWRRGFGSVEVEDFSLKEENFEKIANEIKSKIENLKGSIRPDNFMNISNTNIYLIKPKDSFWNSWESAMNDLRDDFYRELKKNLGINKIAYRPPYGEREVSPLIIQIKKSNDNYFGIILIWENWNGFESFKNFLESITNYEIKNIL